MIEIAEYLQIKKKDVARSYRSLFRELDFNVSISDPIKSINKIASKIGLKEKTIRKAGEILDKANETGIIDGKNPEIMAASALYAACIITGENKSQSEIAHAVSTSTVSIRNRILEFKTKLGLLSTVN